MAKTADLHEGDRVRWSTPQGKTTGKVVRIMTKPFSIKGTDLKASKDDPRVLVESEKSGAQAGHKPSALQKVGSKDSKATKSKDSKAAKSKDSNAPKSKAKDGKAAKSKGSTTKAKATSKGSKAKPKQGKAKPKQKAS